MSRYKKIIYIDKDGYKRYCDSDKLVHRHVAEMMLGRKLRSGEVVPHKNRNKLDNRRSDL
ncbi:MAG: HNH endonuclease [Candidatus Hodarchaeota archaeon]